MQSSPPTASQTTASESTPPPSSSPSSQHGLEQRDFGHGHRPVANPDGSSSEPSDGWFEVNAEDVAETSHSVIESRDQRLSRSPAPPGTPSAANRIAEYENALSPSPRRDPGIPFKIVKSSKKNRLSEVSIQDFPNGEQDLNSLGTTTNIQQRFLFTFCRIFRPQVYQQLASSPVDSTAL